MKSRYNFTITEEARRLLQQHAERSGQSMSAVVERLIREEEERWQENLRRIAQSAWMIPTKEQRKK